MPSNINTDDDIEYGECYECGGEYPTDELYENEHDTRSRVRCGSCDSEYTEEYEDSQSDNDEIDSYGAKPSPNFLNDDGRQSYYVSYVDDNNTITPLYMGMEIEVERTRDSDYDLNDSAAAVKNICGRNVVYCKEDGSLSDGFEIVTHPGTLGFFMRHFAWDGISQLKSKGFSSWNARSCGLHIHLSRSAFTSDKHLSVFIHFMYSNRYQMVRFAGRESTYASWSKDSLLNAYNDWDADSVRRSGIAKFIKNGGRNNERYTAINLRNRDTIELRFFRPSLNTQTLKAALQLCDAVHQYTDVITIRDMALNNALDLRSFRSWIGTQGDKYSILAHRMDMRCAEDLS